MSNENTGGPAFPSADFEQHEYTGMTLRDYFAAYFAAKAMQGYLADVGWRSEVSPRGTAEAAYRMADAMLEARK